MAKVVTDNSHYKAIANTIRNNPVASFGEMQPKDMAGNIETIINGMYQFGYGEGEQSGLAACADKHFVHNFIGDGGASYSFHVPFEPDFIQIFCFEPTVINKASVLASFFYDQRAFGLYAGTYQYGSGSGSLKNGAFSTASASKRYIRAEDGTITVKDFVPSDVVVYGSGLPYTIIAVKYAEQSDKERITAFVNGLTGNGSVSLKQSKINAAFTTDEWTSLVGQEHLLGWTFNWI